MNWPRLRAVSYIYPYYPIPALTGLQKAIKQAQVDLEQHNKKLAHKLGPQGVRVNGVHAGLTTEDSDDIDNVKLFMDQSLLGRLVEMNEITEAILFLASNDACMITGATLPVDGGLTLTS